MTKIAQYAICLSYLKASTTISSVCPCTPLQEKRSNVYTQKRHLAEIESTRKFGVHTQIIHSLLPFYTQTTAQKGRLQTCLCSEFHVHHYRLKIPLRHRLKANFTARPCCPNTSVQLESWDLQGVQSSYKVSCWELIKQLLCYQNLCLESLASKLLSTDEALSHEILNLHKCCSLWV